VFVRRSERYGDPRTELLRGEAWEQVRDSVARSLERATDPQVELARRQQQLAAVYTEVRTNLPHNTALQVLEKDGQPYVSLSALSAQTESDQLRTLRTQLAQRLPQVELAALLLEVDAFTGFARAFPHVADGQPATADLPLSICAVLLALAYRYDRSSYPSNLTET
jgi:hypothetical protein